ncbi:MAG: hypothetical protein GX552_18435 [Chloroflexi bacterium]|jgi:hypothetical protein|nr:hypothetical protein [Chloroflexota bacterium]
MRPIEVIHLNRQDSVDVIRELIYSATPGAQLWLAVPWRAKVLRDLVSLKRIKRTAEMAGIELCLASAHFQTRILAREAGIPAYFQLPLALRGYKKARPQTAAGQASRVVQAHEAAHARLRRPRTISLGVVLLSLLSFVVLVGVLGGAAIGLVPSATMTLEPVAQEVSGNLDVSVDPFLHEVDYGRAIVPARFVQVIVTGRGDTPASGRLDVPDGHAAGDVVFINRTTDQVVIPKGTIVRTGSGVNVRFYTVADVVVPAQLYGHARVGVIALDPGPLGNVQELTINVLEGDAAPRVEVLNDAATYGGSVSRLPVVAPGDMDRLRAEMIERLQAEAHEQLVAELEEGEFIPSESLNTQIMEEHFDQVLDERSDVLSMEMKVVVRGVAVDGRALEDFVGHFLASRVDEGLALIDGSLDLQRSANVRTEGNVMTFNITARGMVAPVIDVESIKRELRGKKLADARLWLREELELRSEPHIVVSPEWWDYLPWLPARLNVTISSGEEHAALGAGRGG